jgi:hypothetical protein
MTMYQTQAEPTNKAEEENAALEAALNEMESRLRGGFRRTFLLTISFGLLFGLIGIAVGTLPAVRAQITPVLSKLGLAPEMSTEDPFGMYATEGHAQGSASGGFDRMEMEREVESLRGELTALQAQVMESRHALEASKRFDGTINVDGRTYRVLGTSEPGQPHVFKFEQVSEFLQRNPEMLVVIVSERTGS